MPLACTRLAGNPTLLECGKFGLTILPPVQSSPAPLWKTAPPHRLDLIEKPNNEEAEIRYTPTQAGVFDLHLWAEMRSDVLDQRVPKGGCASAGVGHLPPASTAHRGSDVTEEESTEALKVGLRADCGRKKKDKATKDR